MFWKVSLPAVSPSILTGPMIGLGNAFVNTVALVNTVAAELAGATTGIGYMMLTARDSFRTDIVILGMVLVMLMGTGLMALMLTVRGYMLRWAYDRCDE